MGRSRKAELHADDSSSAELGFLKPVRLSMTGTYNV